MPNDIALRPAAAAAEPLRPPAPRALNPDQGGRAPSAGAVPPPPPAMPNPALRLDGALGMVVIEFRDTAGRVANSIPSPREMAAYRAAALTDGPMPVAPVPEPAPDAG